MFHRLYYEKAERVLLSSSNNSNGYNLVTFPFTFGGFRGGILNTPLILGGRLISKPIVSFDLKDVAIGFIRLVQHRLSVRSPLTFSDDEPITWWNVGLGTGYFHYKTKHNSTVFPPLQTATSIDTYNVYNRFNPSPHIHGWGTGILGYGFDERFLKHVLYNSQNVMHLECGGPCSYAQWSPRGLF